MSYFGPHGVQGVYMHPSLKVYIQCFLSAPFPKAFPRGGGIWDQDPILMRDFRIIRKFEREWKEGMEQSEAIKSQIGQSQQGGGGTAGLNDVLNQFIDSMGEDAYG